MSSRKGFEVDLTPTSVWNWNLIVSDSETDRV